MIPPFKLNPSAKSIGVCVGSDRSRAIGVNQSLANVSFL